MICGKDIENLIKILEKRKLKFFHACQLQDFESYLKLGGIPSRSLLEQKGWPFTPFSSDTTDKQRNIWDKVFGNLHDFGQRFECKDINFTPCVFGPILIKMNPKLFLTCSDVSITRVSASNPFYHREHSSFSSAVEFDQNFKDQTSQLLSGPKGMPEVSVTLNNQLLPFSFLEAIIVDPYVIDNHPFVDIVKDLASPYPKIQAVIEERKVNHDWYRILYNLLIKECRLDNVNTTDPKFNTWARCIENSKFTSYASKLKVGTLDFWNKRKVGRVS